MPMANMADESASAPAIEPFTALQAEWTTLWTDTLPRLTTGQSCLQGTPLWSVTVDHSIARIVLDNAVGIDKPWSQVVTPPATINMSNDQLSACVELAKQIMSGEADLITLEENSLILRGIEVSRKADVQGKKRKRSESEVRAPNTSSEIESHRQKNPRKHEAADSWSGISLLKHEPFVPEEEAEMIPDIQAIIAQDVSIKPFQREALTLLTQVPRGRYTTYQALSTAITKREGKVLSSSQASGHARAVGLAMRNDPWAPTVPCHRMLTSDRRIGGFDGNWEAEGRFYTEKLRLLKEEGIGFDEKGRAVDEPFQDLL